MYANERKSRSEKVKRLLAVSSCVLWFHQVARPKESPAMRGEMSLFCFPRYLDRL